MAKRVILYFVLISGLARGQGELSNEKTIEREPRSIKQKLCQKYGVCGGNNGYQGGYQGGQQGYPGQQGVPINIAISQSQSAANGAAGHANGYYPNNQQYNGYPSHGGYSQGQEGYNQGNGGYNPGYGGFNQGYGGYNQGYGGYNQGYGGYNQGYGNYNQGYGNYNQGYGGNGNRPGHFGNGQGSYNNQFNGIYNGGQQSGGYGFQRPFYDDGEDDSREDEESGYGRSLASAESKASS